MTSDDNQQDVANETVGQQLKQAREKQGLSIAQVADAQHLRNSIIQAIENGDYGQIDSELFLKGYVRAYAKQIGLDGDSLIADLDRELEPGRIQKARELEANPLIDIERRKRKKRRLGKLLLLIAIIVLIAAFVVMVVMPKFGVEVGDADSERPAVADQRMGENASPVNAEEPTLSASEPEAGFASENTPEEPSAFDEGSSVPGDSEAEQSMEADIDNQIPVVEQITEPALAQPPGSEDLSAVTGTLEIVFSGDCWVQVRDATGSRLASAMKRAGERLEISGVAPLEVVIGAVNAVESIRFQGEAVGMDDFPVVNNRSEFTLTI